MATSAPTADDRSVSIGRIFNRAFGTIRDNPVATLGIAFVFSALPSLAVNYAVQSMREDILTVLGLWASLGIGLVTIIVSIVLAMMTQGALVRATVAYSEGRQASFAESAMAGLVVVVPLFLLALLSGIALLFGFLLLFVPGVILYVIWSVAAPSLVEERLGPVEALGRSRDLTRGVRWKIFGLILVVLVLYWLVSALMGAISIAWMGGVQGLAEASQQGLPLGLLVVSTILETITSAVWGVILTSLYVELRDWKDGPAAEALADVFG